MFRKPLSLLLALLLTGAITSVPALAQSQTERQSTQAEKIKAKVAKTGTGKRAAVTIKLKDDTKLKGYIGEIAQDHFSVVDPKHGTVNQIPYDQVQQIKNDNRAWLFAGLAGATLGAVVILVSLLLRGS
jgi:hypothetical protein